MSNRQASGERGLRQDGSTYLRCPLCQKLALEFTPRGRDPTAEYSFRVHCWSCSGGCLPSPQGPWSYEDGRKWLYRLAAALKCRPGDVLYEPRKHVAELERATVANGGLPPTVKVWLDGLTDRQVRSLHSNLMREADPWSWLHERGIDQATAVRAQLGYHPKFGVLVIPYQASDGKRFYKTRLLGFDTHTLNMPGQRNWPLYVPNELHVKRRRWALLCEGETDTLRAEASRMPAVGLPNGKNVWRQEWCELLAGLGVQTVVVCLDVGAEAAAKRIASTLGRHGLAAPILDLKQLRLTKKNADLTDYLNGHGGSRTELLGHIKRLATPAKRSLTSSNREVGRIRVRSVRGR